MNIPLIPITAKRSIVCLSERSRHVVVIIQDPACLLIDQVRSLAREARHGIRERHATLAFDCASDDVSQAYADQDD
jgi:hypothetical protein